MTARTFDVGATNARGGGFASQTLPSVVEGGVVVGLPRFDDFGQRTGRAATNVDQQMIAKPAGAILLRRSPTSQAQMILPRGQLMRRGRENFRVPGVWLGVRIR